MCGIFAVRRTEASVEPWLLEMANNTLAHRGRDGGDTWISQDGSVGLAHRRLAVIGIENGSQPIPNEDSSIHAVVNGEFYDFQSIREQLRRVGHVFSTHSDSEILIHLYEEYGASCLRFLRGDFAFVLWDGRNNQLFAAKDRVGSKPLFYATDSKGVYLASEIKALLAAGIEPEWDAQSFFHSVDLGQSVSQTLFKNVRELPAGHYMLANGKNTELIKYWDFNFARFDGNSTKIDEQELIEQFRTCLDESIAIRLKAEVPVGFYLSGGLDSSAILGLAASRMTAPITAFCATFEEAAYCEAKWARTMADAVGAKLIEIPITQADLAQHFDDAVWHAENVFSNGHVVANLLLSSAVRRAGIVVALSGAGGDEILGGYDHFRRDAVATTEIGDMNLSFARGQDALEEERFSGVIRSLAHLGSDPYRRNLGFTPTWIEGTREFANEVRSLFSQDFLNEHSCEDGGTLLLNSLDVEGQLVGRPPLSQSMYLLAKTMLPAYNLATMGDRVEVANGIEVRLPFLDHNFIELLSRIHPSMKIRNGREKHILREALREEVPEIILSRGKQPFLSPPSTLAKNGVFLDYLLDTLSGSTMRDLPFFDKNRIAGLVDEVRHADTKEKLMMDQVITLVASACRLHERFHMSV
jgi:asparagine synthase (glutamine-hydrolysing)